MQRLRLFLAARPLAAFWLLACVLAVRMLVPAGFMPVSTGSGVVLGLCPGAAPAVLADRHAMGMHHGGGAQREAPPPADTSLCAFAGTGVAAAELPGLALAAILVVFTTPRSVLTEQPIPVIAVARWRPPLRAPPLG